LDAEGRRRFEEAKRARAAFIAVRTPYLELVRNGNAEEHKKMLAEKVIPLYQATVDAFGELIDHKDNQGMNAAKVGKAAAQSGVQLIGLALAAALVVAGLLSWQIVRSTTPVLRDLASHADYPREVADWYETMAREVMEALNRTEAEQRLASNDTLWSGPPPDGSRR